MTFEGSSSRTLILLTVLVAASVLCWLDKVDAQATSPWCLRCWAG